ncbi:hypothetical protein [Shewanella xiamenensis]|uniref:Cytochrome P460 domain-containing protein n=2 Tax=Shewanella TaxID=22 RepID=A0ABT6UG58_9GAMM|nr:hypothetical protein [Shewanella xiamenensis]MDI5833458.1 hypothetical protein [Shewanella xiamenensis]
MKLFNILLSYFFILFLASNAQAEGGLIELDNYKFKCIRDLSGVRDFYVDNYLGKEALQKTLVIANSISGGEYPEGTVIQLVPTEIMIKRAKGTNKETNDWEFFDLNVSKNGTTVLTRGFKDVTNRFGGNCFECHSKAENKWDLICEKNHGCAPIPLTREMIKALQKTDPRCDTKVSLSDGENEALKMLTNLIQN